MPEQLILTAPVSGQIVPLDKVPDPVFASKMVGDGLAIDPFSDCLLAPCAGSIAQIHPSNHALTLKSDTGLEILIHVGLDSVSLRGQGFRPLVTIGEKVQSGQRLLEFDADYIALNCRSLLTEILITNTEMMDSLQVSSGLVTAGQTPIATIALRTDLGSPQDTANNTEANITGEVSYSPEISIRNEQGLHARPAATLANTAKRFDANIELIYGDKHANCKSVLALLAMQIAYGDKVVLRASGAQREEALKALTTAIRSGLGEALGSAPLAQKAQSTSAQSAQMVTATSAPASDDSPSGIFRGTPASPGLALGRLYCLRRREIQVNSTSTNPTQERQLLDKVLGQAQSELEVLEKNLRQQTDNARAAIFAAHRELLADPCLVDTAHKGILSGLSAAFAWKQTYTEQAEALSHLDNSLLAARATDIRDAGERVLRLLTGQEKNLPDFPEGTILVAEELTPSDMASLDRSKVVGIATVLGGTTSHTSILARSMDIPALTGISTKLLDIPDGTTVLLDSSKGVIDTTLSPDAVEATKKRLDEQAQLKQLYLQHVHEPAITSDGHRIAVVANVGSLDDARQGLKLGSEGVGLLRTEFLFMGRNTAPSEEEQTKVYSNISQAVGTSQPLVIRTIDVGGDKPLPYLPIPKEDNPFLGERGVRLCLNRPELLRTQFRAILKASRNAQLMVMLPMVTSIDEFREAKAMFAHEINVLQVEPIPLGVMIEVPTAALMADVLAREADFFSIGTNDLTQYTLAIDRCHPKLASQADALCPGVLRLIELTVAGGHKHQRKVGVCGGLAGELSAVPILVGLGVDTLSVPAPAIPAIKYTIRQLSYEKCRALATQALDCENAARVRELVEAQQI